MNHHKTVIIFGHPLVSNISSDSVVVDIGGHVGKFAKEIINRYGANVISYEPLDRYDAPLTEVAKLYPDKFTRVKKAVWKKTGSVVVFDYSCQANSIIQRINKGKVRKLKGKIQVKCITLEDVLKRLTNISLVKINIEGAEIEVIKATPDEVLKKCSQLSISFHVWIGDQFKSIRTKKQVREIIKRFKDLGFHAHKYGNKPDYLFINENI